MHRVKRLLAALAVVLVTAAPAHAYEVNTAYDNDRTALAVVHPDGHWSGSDAALEPRPALSLSKLFLGYWILYNGTDEEKELVEEMISVSHDGYAQRFDRKYPEAIDEIADDFNLQYTARSGAWGRTVTSAYDVASFVSDILWDPRAKPLLDGMRDKPEVARDGFHQLFGAAELNRVEGVKTGWSDDRVSQTGSVSFGQIGDEVWVVAALTWGDSEENTEDVLDGINQIDDRAAREKRDYWKPGGSMPVKFTDLDLR
ncbi:hypothetical protein [Corynebacterium qintianiae]|uniref:hypothetical protein n=1 Tax=Corynebacterium qintianiae TaxID=2709392 RepID=UPI0013EB4B63|nr:hypothetical protein [Corynebacterium qintianiae]